MFRRGCVAAAAARASTAGPHRRGSSALLSASPPSGLLHPAACAAARWNGASASDGGGAAAAAAPPPLTREQVGAVLSQVRGQGERSDESSEEPLELDEIQQVTLHLTKCMGPEFVDVAVEILVQRAEAADDKCLPVPALLAFADVVAAGNAAFRAGAVTSDQLFFQAAWATFADGSGKVPPAALSACAKVAYLGAPPKEAEAVVGAAASPVSTEEFAAQLRAKGVPLPDYSHRQGALKSKSKWMKYAGYAVAIFVYMKVSDSGLLHTLIESNPIGKA
eukprot:Rhum_TRINITY_DN13402_c1_g2::Rhum_TRINITY_DN13402_c1_g2_i1::g.59889::m.59889